MNSNPNYSNGYSLYYQHTNSGQLPIPSQSQNSNPVSSALPFIPHSSIYSQPLSSPWGGPTHSKSYSQGSLPAHSLPSLSSKLHHHSKSKSLNLIHTLQATYDINYPIQQLSALQSSHYSPELLLQIPQISDIATKKYSTSIDSRSFITVYEYQIGSNWIIWDYHTGLVHLTGLWKLIGNKKLDIVKLVDSSPELITVVKRVRGGFLKIQGTWIPYDIAKKLASKFCYDIRFSLIPLFGPSFVDECLRPDQVGFGMLRLVDTTNHRSSRRAKRNVEPMTPYLYYANPQQLPTPSSSTESSSSNFQTFNSFSSQSSLVSPLEPYHGSSSNLPKLHTFVTNPVLKNGDFAGQDPVLNPHCQTDESLSPKSSFFASTPKMKTNTHKVHKKLKSASSINLNTVLELAIELGDTRSNFKEEDDDPLYGYDKSVIDAASSLMSVSHSWRQSQLNLDLMPHSKKTPVSLAPDKLKNKMDIKGLLS